MYSVLGKYMYYCAIMFGPIFTHVRFLSSVQYPVPDHYGQNGIALLEKLILFFNEYISIPIHSIKKLVFIIMEFVYLHVFKIDNW